MEGLSVFRKLTAFAKFDLKRFQADAERLQLQKKPTTPDNASQGDTSKPENVCYNNTIDQVKKKRKKKKKKIDEEQAKLEAEKKKKKKMMKKNKASEPVEEESDESYGKRMRNKYYIHTRGTDIPPLLRSFQDLVDTYHLNKKIVSNVQAQGYSEPTSIQRQAITMMLHGRDLIACAPTGSGKTAAFIIPVIHDLIQSAESTAKVDESRVVWGPQETKCNDSTQETDRQTDGLNTPLALVLVPTRELAKQCQREFDKLSADLGLKSLVIDNEKILKRRWKFDILITTPKRLLAMLEQDTQKSKKPLTPLVDISHLRWLIVDECDKLFETGKDGGFRNQLGTIYKACANPDLHRALFSATFAKEVRKWCRLNFDNVVEVQIGQRNTATSSVDQKIVYAMDEYGKLVALRNLIKEGFTPPMLIFVQSKERAEELLMELKYENIRIDVIHGDQTQGKRDNVVQDFRAGLTWVLICTDMMARGMDFKGVGFVLNYDFPNSDISYIHRVGRTGRAGRRGKAVTLFTDQDKPLLRVIAGAMREAGCPVPEYMLSMNKPGQTQQRRLVKVEPKRDTILTMQAEDLERFKVRMNKKKARLEKRQAYADKNNSRKVGKDKVPQQMRRIKRKGELKKGKSGKDKKSKDVKDKVSLKRKAQPQNGKAGKKRKVEQNKKSKPKSKTFFTNKKRRKN